MPGRPPTLASSSTRALQQIAAAAGAAVGIAIDMSGIEQFDTYGAWLLRRLCRVFAERGKDVQVVGLAERFRGLQQDVDQLTVETRRWSWARGRPTDVLEQVGRWMIEAWRQLILFVAMVGPRPQR